MYMTDAASGAFAVAFRDAVNQSGMTLVEVVDALAERGIKLTQATLSYWQSGRSLPRRQSSLKALREIEIVLGVEKGSLVRSLEEDAQDTTSSATSRVQSYAHGVGVPDVLYGAPRDLDASLIDWHNEAQQKFMHVTVAISDGGRKAVTRTEGIVRISSVVSPTTHIATSWGLGDAPPVVTDLYGGHMDTPIMDAENRYQLIPVRLGEGKRMGELHQIGYTLEAVSAAPFTRTEQRWFAWPLDMYALTVDFGDTVPKFVEWVTVQTRVTVNGVARVETARELAVINGVCQATSDHNSNESSFIRWRW